MASYDLWRLSSGASLCLRDGKPVAILAPSWMGPVLLLRLAKEEYGLLLRLGTPRPRGNQKVWEVLWARQTLPSWEEEEERD